MAPSTVYRVLVRNEVNRLDHLDRATATPIRRYEHKAPGDLVHVDVEKLGRIPPGGGHRVHGRAEARRRGRGRVGYAYVHTAIDDHSRLAYSEVLPDERGATAAGFWHRAEAWFRAQGVVVLRVLTGNGSCYRGQLFNEALGAIKHRYWRPYRPQTNGKVEHRTLSPDPARGVGLRTPLLAGARPDPGPCALAAHLQPSPGSHRHRWPTGVTCHQPPAEVHLTGLRPSPTRRCSRRSHVG